VVNIINKKSSKSVRVMSLVRHPVLSTLQYRVSFEAHALSVITVTPLYSDKKVNQTLISSRIDFDTRILQLKNKKIIFNIDNQSVVNIINKKSSKSVRVMSLVRHPVLSTLQYNIMIKALHISGISNKIADSLSRCDWRGAIELIVLINSLRLVDASQLSVSFSVLNPRVFW
jgi:hypothetical protein